MTEGASPDGASPVAGPICVVGANGQVGYERVRKVVNAAAYTAVDRAESDAERCRVVNAVAPGALAEAAAQCEAPFVQYSTDYVFDGDNDGLYREEDAPNPRSVYGATELSGERAALAANPGAAVFRTSWVYGARGNHFVRTMLRLHCSW